MHWNYCQVKQAVGKMNSQTRNMALPSRGIFSKALFAFAVASLAACLGEAAFLAIKNGRVPWILHLLWTIIEAVSLAVFVWTGWKSVPVDGEVFKFAFVGAVNAVLAMALAATSLAILLLDGFFGAKIVSYFALIMTLYALSAAAKVLVVAMRYR